MASRAAGLKAGSHEISVFMELCAFLTGNGVSSGCRNLRIFFFEGVVEERAIVPDLLKLRDDFLTTVDGRSEEHTSELQSLMRISYAVFCLKQKTICNNKRQHIVL